VNPITNQDVHIISAILWGIYGITIGTLTLVYHYGGYYSWASIIVAIVGNSVHLITFALSKGQTTLSSTKT
jgi:uncharacterized membrane protein YeaQ/YmgE (transglycosylase-associated protein family)